MEEGLRKSSFCGRMGVKFVKDAFNDAFNEGPGDFMATPASAGNLNYAAQELTGCKKNEEGREN